MMILSILICSINSRAHLLKKLFQHVDNQIRDRAEVEIKVLADNKVMTTGAKRNALVRDANGKYVVFIDDDDWVPDYYVKFMVNACKSDADCVAINGTMTTDGMNEIKWRLGKDYDNVTIVENQFPVYLRRTNHITAVKREHVLRVMFPNKSNGEDKAFSDAVNQYLKTEAKIEKPMYHYRFSTKDKQYK